MRRVRRPSPALLVALLALFVALGGPAQAARLINGKEIKKGTIRSRQVKDRSLGVRDLSRSAVRTLTATPNGSITDSKLATGAVTARSLAGASVTAGKLAAGSVGTIPLADGAVTNAKVANGAITHAKIAPGALTAADVARFGGLFTADVTAASHGCWAAEIPLHADITNDVVDVTPGTAWPRNNLDFSVQTSPTRTGFVISGCNRGSTAVNVPNVVFRYLVFDIP